MAGKILSHVTKRFPRAVSETILLELKWLLAALQLVLYRLHYWGPHLSQFDQVTWSSKLTNLHGFDVATC